MILPEKRLTALHERVGKITSIFTDVDGVLTPGTNYVELLFAVEGEAHLRLLESQGMESCEIMNPHDTDAKMLIARTVGSVCFESYRFNTRDGIAIEYLKKAGMPVSFISGRNAPPVRVRAEALGAVPLLGVKDKLSVIKECCADLSTVLFIGDGIQDCEALRAVGVGIAPSDASPEAVSAASGVTETKGGEGVLYEVVRTLFRDRVKWPT